MHPKTSDKLPAAVQLILRIIEVYLPALCLILLFISFIIGIITRYILNNPQAWTYEFSTICFFNLVFISWPLVQESHEHIVFDMFYERRSSKVKHIFNYMGNIIIAVCAFTLFPTSISYLQSMKGLTSQVIHIPRQIIYLCYPVSLLLSGSIAIIDIFVDVRTKNGDNKK